MRKSLVALGLAVSIMGFAAPPPVSASHDWAHFYNKTLVQGNPWDKWRISAYTDSDSNNNRAYPWSADFTYVFWFVAYCSNCSPWVASRSATCGPAANQCERAATSSSDIVREGGAYFLRTIHCGYDDVSGVRHETPQEFDQATCNLNGLIAHKHELTFT